ncbi:MAG: Uma2 family endonuclease [Leptolyngbya sp. SIO1D8]|nr:Uma2 family endonuclease [Leptolyngbya sp. SIO1D8]
MTSITPNLSAVIYPDSNGQPIADNTKQFRWIVTIKENLELLFAKQPDVFVAGDLLWYTVQGDNTIRQAPDALVVFGRPKGDRGSYQQWNEENIPPQVVFEILPPGNRPSEMMRKFKFYERYEVQEYYVYDPDDIELMGWWRQHNKLVTIDDIHDWVSPQLQIRFVMGKTELEIYRPDGRKFLTTLELEEKAQAAEKRAESAEDRARAAEELLVRYRDRFGDLEE